MTEPQFTPGPWEPKYRGAIGSSGVKMYWLNELLSVCTENDADVRLVAAAPELFEWLEAALDEREQDHGSLPDDAPHWSVRARHVLSKVRGDQ